MSSNPITSVAPSSSPITSVQPQYSQTPLYAAPNTQLLTRLNLDLRGRIFPVERETLMLLPESVLLGLFPQGLILSKPASWNGADDGVFAVDVSVCLGGLGLFMLIRLCVLFQSSYIFVFPIPHLRSMIYITLIESHVYCDSCYAALDDTSSSTTTVFALILTSTTTVRPRLFPIHPGLLERSAR